MIRQIKVKVKQLKWLNEQLRNKRLKVKLNHTIMYIKNKIINYTQEVMHEKKKYTQVKIQN